MYSTEIRYKVVIRAFKSGPWSSVIEAPVTKVSWDTKKSYWLTHLGYAHKPHEPPLLFSKISAEAVVKQLPRWNFEGPGPGGKATATIVPVEVKHK